MAIQPIRNAADHSSAMARIASLWGSPEGSAEAEELEALVTMVDAYEAAQHGFAAQESVQAMLPGAAAPGEGKG